MSMPLRVLILEDREADAELILYELHKARIGLIAQRVATEQAFIAALDESIDIILADYALPQFDALQALKLVQARGLDIPFIIISGTVGEELAVAAIREGAIDYLLKDRLARLATAIRHAIEQRDLRREKQQADTRYRMLVEHIPAIVYIAALDEASSTLYVNSQIETLLGFSATEWTSDPHRWLKQLHPQDIDLVLDNIARSRVVETPITSEFRMITRDERVMWFRDEAVVVRDASGQPLFLQGIMLDITERKHAEQKLQENEERYRLITEHTSDLISLTDDEDVFIYASPSYYHILGFDPQQLVGMSVAQILHPDQLVAMQQTRLQGASYDTQRWHHANGSWRWIEVQYTAVVQQETRYIVGIGRDVTERKNLEAQFLHSQKMESIGQLVGGVSHDFNNLLTAINGYAELALASLPTDTIVREDIEEIIKAAERAATLTRQLLAFASKQVIAPHVLNLNRLISELEKLLRRLLGEHIEFTTQLAHDLGNVKADPGQIEQVLVNLAVNARDAMPEGGTLVIQTRNIEVEPHTTYHAGTIMPGSYISVVISDTGSGMDAVTQQHIFEPFFTTKDAGRGTGLGLATCYGIMKQHAGYISVESIRNQGTVFTLYLPRVYAEIEQLPEPIASSYVPQKSETIVVVEDNRAVRLLVVRVLRDQGYVVLEAENGDAALKMVSHYAEGAIELLVTDLIMPHMSGRELFEQLQQLLPTLRVLFISGYTEDEVIHHSRPEIGKAFLHKPFSPATLIRKVREVLDQI